MNKDGKFGPNEAIWMTIIAITIKASFSGPSNLAGLIGNTGWYMIYISAAVALLGFAFIYLLLKRFPENDISEIFELTFGRVVGFIFSGILAMYLLWTAFSGAEEFVQIIKVYNFPLSPKVYITAIYMIGVLVMSLLGLENIARFTKVTIYFTMTGFVVIYILGSQNFNTNNLFPILGYGLGKTVTAGIVRSSIFGEVILLAVFAQSLQGVGYIKKEGIISIVLSAFFISATLFSYSLTFPYFIGQEITSPLYELSTLIDYGRHIQRLEPIFLFTLIISSLITTTVIYYAFITIYCKMFKISDRKPIIIAGVFVLMSASLLQPDVVSTFEQVQVLRKYGSLVTFGLPVLTFLAAMILKKGEKGKNA